MDEAEETSNEPEASTEQRRKDSMPQIKYCPACGTQNDIKNNFCTKCGKRLTINTEQPNDYEKINFNTSNDIITCPLCGSTNIHFITIQASQNFDGKDACCGYLFCGTPGALCCGIKDKTEAETIRKCMSCNYEF